MKTMLNAKEVAEMTGLAYSTVRRLATTPGAKFPPSVKIGRSRRWSLEQLEKTTKFDFVSSWYSWERECVKNEITQGNYNLDTDVTISILKNSKTLYNVGSGHLVHTKEGFHLTGCNGRLDINTTVRESYSLYSDYFWYEIGDVICIGNGDLLYYCFPEDKKVNVAKARLAAEELYKLEAK